MDLGLIILLVVVIAIALAVGVGPSWRRSVSSAEDEMHAVAPGADVDRQFRRPRNEGDLL